MRFVSATISGFAGISRTAEIDLDANVVVLLGSNGFGKSTICDALFWALTGVHPRGADPRSWYGTGETYVEVTLRATDGELISIRRMVTNPDAEFAKLQTSIVLEAGSDRARGHEAEFLLARRLMSDPSDGSAVSSTLTDSLYLQQDSLREFLSSRSDDERFAALSQMVGARSLSDLVAAFDAASRAWRKSVRQTAADLDVSRTESDGLRAEIGNLEQVVAESEQVQSAEVDAWWERACQLLGVPASNDLVTENDLERAVVDLGGMVNGDLDRKQRIQILRQELGALLDAEGPTPVSAVRVEDLRAQEERVSLHQQRLDAASVQVQAARSALQAVESGREEFAALAQLALRHLSDSCPTCGQDVDPDALRRRLESLLVDESPEQAREADALSTAIEQRDVVATELAAAETRLRTMRTAADAYDQFMMALSERDGLRQALISELTDLVGGQLTDADWRTVVDESLARIDRRVATATEHLNTYEVLAPALRTSGNAVRLANLRDEYAQLEAAFALRRSELEDLTRTQNFAAEVLDGAKERFRELPQRSLACDAADPRTTLRSHRSTPDVAATAARDPELVRKESAVRHTHGFGY